MRITQIKTICEKEKDDHDRKVNILLLEGWTIYKVVHWHYGYHTIMAWEE